MTNSKLLYTMIYVWAHVINMYDDDWVRSEIHMVLNILRLRQNGCQFPDHNFKSFFLNENKQNFIKPASNNAGCICEQIWKEQCCMKTYIAVNLTKWYCSKICIKLVTTIKNVLTFVMPLNWAAIIGYMSARGRPFYSNDVILLHQVTVPLHQGMVPLFGLHQTQ